MNIDRKAGKIQNNKDFPNEINIAYGNNQLPGLNSNFGGKPAINNVAGTKNTVNVNQIKKPQKFSQEDLNEAKEALKSLQMKMKAAGNIKPQTAGRMREAGVNGNNNYRKPFVPTFDLEEESPQDKDKVISIKNTGPALPKGKAGFISDMLSNPVDDRAAVASGNPKLDVSPYPEDDPGEENLQECPDCGRKFNETVFEKHAKNCKKVFLQKRKAFDTKKQRILDSEHQAILKQKEIEEKKKGKGGAHISNSKSLSTLASNKKNKWKKQSEEFRAIIKANKPTDEDENQYMNKAVVASSGMSMNSGKNVSGASSVTKNVHQFTSSAVTDDYIACQFCNRRYNEQAYTKHLAGCERRAKEATLKNKINKSGGVESSNVGYKHPPNGKYGRK